MPQVVWFVENHRGNERGSEWATSRQADEQTNRQADKQTSRQADKQTSRRADKQIGELKTSVCPFVCLSVCPFRPFRPFRPFVVNYNPRLSSVSLVSKTPNKKKHPLMKRVPLNIGFNQVITRGK